jgi:hypothetical protein
MHINTHEFTRIHMLQERGGPLSVIGVMPFGVSAGAVYNIFDHSSNIRRSVVLMPQVQARLRF